jgi:hypothetical protein
MNINPRKPEHADKRGPVSSAPGYEIERRFVDYAYPRNGNVGNPTPRYRWNLYLDGKLVDMDTRRAILVQGAKKDSYR